MRVSEVIDALQKGIDEYGDHDLVIRGQDGHE